MDISLKWAVFNIKNSQITRDTLWKLRYFFIENLTVFFIPKSQVINISMQTVIITL